MRRRRGKVTKRLPTARRSRSQATEERCGSALREPAVRGVLVHREPSMLSGQYPQVVQVTAGRGAHRVVAVRDADDRAVAEEHSPRVAVAVGVVQALEAEAVGAVEAEVVDLLEHRLAVRTVVLVWRERRPLTGLVERLADEEM